MGRKVIITIGREFGSEGHEIGKELAERLGINMYDKDLLAIAAKRSGLAVEHLANVDESIATRFLEPYLGFSMGNENLNDKLFAVESQIIRDIASKESCIIIGRCADFVLKDEENCINAFIYAPYETRVNMIAQKHKITEEAARKLVKKMDQVRNSYYTFYAGKDWNRKEGKDLMLNRARFGIKGCVDILEAAYRECYECDE
ncbi:MAG: cytidylate kinase-like family protein [Lachnospiraceae bacterium]|nr:cytidylate kinase-like family protein [Lachnospiraceae bacterium]